MEGRQAYFMELIAEGLGHGWTTKPEASLEVIYTAVDAEAEPHWIDDEPCRHGAKQFEWQHDVRYTLLKLRTAGVIERVRRATYRLT